MADLNVLKIYNTVSELVSEKRLDKDNYMKLVVATMEVIEQTKDVTTLSENEKVSLLVRVILNIVQDSDEEIMKTILTETTIRNLAELALDIVRGKYALEKKAESAWKKLVKCCSCKK